MTESGDYVPAPHWSGHDFASARRVYDDKIKHTFSDAVKKNITAESLLPESLETNSSWPMIIVCDVTGSMSDWPATIFSKLPYLEHEGKEYLGEDMEISFSAVGDANDDKYPLQVQPFAKASDLKTNLEKLIHERGGGGTKQESYDLAALYYLHNCECPEAIHKPIMIFIGDEGLYEYVSKEQAELFAKTKLESRISLNSVFEELTEKFSVYLIRKPYRISLNENVISGDDQIIENQWRELLGSDRIVSLPGAERVVDVIFGILAKETDRSDYFEKELKDRQLKDKDGDKKVEIVMKSLKTIYTDSKRTNKKIPIAKSKSITKSKGANSKSKKSQSLLDD